MDVGRTLHERSKPLLGGLQRPLGLELTGPVGGEAEHADDLAVGAEQR